MRWRALKLVWPGVTQTGTNGADKRHNYEGLRPCDLILVAGCDLDHLNCCSSLCTTAAMCDLHSVCLKSVFHTHKPPLRGNNLLTVPNPRVKRISPGIIPTISSRPSKPRDQRDSSRNTPDAISAAPPSSPAQLACVKHSVAVAAASESPFDRHLPCPSRQTAVVWTAPGRTGYSRPPASSPTPTG